MTIFNVLTLIGGLAMFLYGMNVMGNGLEKLAGGKLEKIFERLTSNPIKAMLLGLSVTAVIQSSSATTVMLVGFVNAGIMKLHSAIGVIMGANIGTTVTAWILSLSGLNGDSFIINMLKPSSFSPILAIIGVAMLTFSQWDPANPKNKYEGTAEQWEHAQAAMKTILDDLGVDYDIGIDEAAFYGPKLDIQYKNVYGKEDTLVTIQIDMLLAERFGMYYVDKDGQKKLPYIIHRTSLGCFERTLAYMLEHFNGVLPLWLAPEQVRLLPIKEGHAEYAQKIADRMTAMGMRVTVDNRDEDTF